MGSRVLKIVLVLVMLIQPVVTVASACEGPHSMNGSTMESLNTMGHEFKKMNEADLSGGPCHTSNDITPPSSTDCSSCVNGIGCSSSCSLAASIAYAVSVFDKTVRTSNMGVEPKSLHPLNDPSGLYRPPRLS